MVEWGFFSNLISIVTPIVIVLITYVKTWSKFEIMINNLTENVEELSKTVETLQAAQEEMMQRLTKVEVQLDGMLEKIYLLHKVEKPCLGS